MGRSPRRPRHHKSSLLMSLHARTPGFSMGFWRWVRYPSSAPLLPAVQARLSHDLHSYFRSKFHVVDSLVVVGGFILDISLHGAIEEAASLIVVLRLWRVFKIIEELSVGAQEQVDHLGEQIENLTKENLGLRDEVKKREEDVAKLKGEIARVKGVVDE
jgi:hypothetical protein